MTLTDEQLVQLLRDVDLPATPADRVSSVQRRHRSGVVRRGFAAGVAAVVAVSVAVAVVSAPTHEQTRELPGGGGTTGGTSQLKTAETPAHPLRNAAHAPRTARYSYAVGSKTIVGFASYKERIEAWDGIEDGKVVQRQIRIGDEAWSFIDLSSLYAAGATPRRPWSKQFDVGRYSAFNPAIDYDSYRRRGVEPVFLKRAVVRGTATDVWTLRSEDGRIDYWVDDAGLARRIQQYTKPFTSPFLTVDLYDFGAQQAVEPPPADQVDMGMYESCRQKRVIRTESGVYDCRPISGSSLTTHGPLFESP